MDSGTQGRIAQAVELLLEHPEDPRHGAACVTLARMCRYRLSYFVMAMWTVLEPGTKLEWAWYHDLICEELELVTERYTKGIRSRLVICQPPGTMKSLLASVFHPAWWWLRDPTVRFLALSSTDTLATRDSRRMRDVITSDLYQMLALKLMEHGLLRKWEMSADQRSVVNFANSERGGRACFAIGGSLTGHRGDGLIIDDPHQVKDVLGNPEQVAAALEKVHDKVDVALPSRVNDQRRMFEIVIQQRVHEDDVAGRRLKDDDPDLRSVVLSMHYDPANPQNHKKDPRKEPGELLDPVRFPGPIVRRLISKLDQQVPGQGQAQYEQRPAPSAGGLFRREWMQQRYDFDPQRPPQGFRWHELVVTVDCTFKRSKKSDFVSAQCWGRVGYSKFYLMDEVHERLSYTELRAAVRDFVIKWRPHAILIEEKANGAALIDELRNEFPAVVPFLPDKHGDKVSRAHLATPFFMGGNIWLPQPEHARWIGDWVTEMASFPLGIHDDRVDAVSQLFLWWGDRIRTGGTEAVNDAMSALLGGSVPLGSQW